MFVILFTPKCQLYIWEQSHAFSSIVAFVYKLLWFPYQITYYMYSNVTTSTRINSSSLHTYICVCFHSKPVQHIKFYTGFVDPIQYSTIWWSSLETWRPGDVLTWWPTSPHPPVLISNGGHRKHVQLASGWYASYWNALFLLLSSLLIASYVTTETS